MSGRLIQMAVDQVAARAYQGQLGVSGGARREGSQQHLDGPCLPVERQGERMIGQQPGRITPVARRLGMPNGFDHMTALGEPRGGAAVQLRQLIRQRPAQLQPEHIPEQLVETEPGPPGVER